MSLWVVGHSRVGPADLAAFSLPPAWRKATRNMVLAAVAARTALGPLGRVLGAGTDELGLIVQTRSGELETSAEFLKNWTESKLARPLLFQNSLHNATAGFLSIEFQLRGPAFTVSTSSEDAVVLAKSLLAGGICRGCLILSVEVHKRMADLIHQTDVDEGAAAILLLTEDFARQNGVPRLADLEDLPASAEPLVSAGSPLVRFSGDLLSRWSLELGARA